MCEDRRRIGKSEHGQKEHKRQSLCLVDPLFAAAKPVKQTVTVGHFICFNAVNGKGGKNIQSPQILFDIISLTCRRRRRVLN